MLSVPLILELSSHAIYFVYMIATGVLSGTGLIKQRLDIEITKARSDMYKNV